nr:unnamed protein product [Spirometra erinaceieuropaei]
MIRQLYDGLLVRVTDNGAVTEALAVTNGVKQGCVLPPTLFSLKFSTMPMDAYRDERPGIHVVYRMDGQLLNQRGYTSSRVFKMYEVVILPILLDGVETWMVPKKQARKINRLQSNCLRQILKLKWQDRIPDTEVLERTGILSSHAVLRKLLLHWNGHLVRIDDERLSNRPFYGDVVTGSRRKEVEFGATRTL